MGLQMGRGQLVPKAVYGEPAAYHPSQLTAPTLAIYIDPLMNNQDWAADIRKQLEQDTSGRFRLVGPEEARSAAVVISDHDARLRPEQVLVDVATKKAADAVTPALIAHMDGQAMFAVPGGIIMLYRGDQGADVALFA